MNGADKKDGSLEETRQAAETLGVAGRVTLPGPVDKRLVPETLAGADIFLNTSRVDNAPVSVVEAMACGLCIVSTNVGGIPHLAEHEEEALLVPPGDAEAMAGAVARLLREPALASRLSRAARAKAEQFDWSAALPAWEGLLEAAARA